jgi:AAA15 family ATPase/GTPase
MAETERMVAEETKTREKITYLLIPPLPPSYNEATGRDWNMLISLTFRNLFSFKELTNFSMVAGRSKKKEARTAFLTSDLQVLKFSALYGANASGKSNFIKALKEMQNLVLNGPYAFLRKNAFQGDSKTEKAPSYFEACLFLDGQALDFGFEFNYSTNSFTSEWLHLVQGNKETVLYERDILKGTFDWKAPLDSQDLSRMDVYREDLKKDSSRLFLNYVSTNGKALVSDSIDSIRAVFSWFRNTLAIAFPEDDLTSPSYFLSDTKLDELSSFLSKYDTGIDHLETEDMRPDEVDEILPHSWKEQVRKDLEAKPSSQILLRSPKSVILAENKKGNLLFRKVIFVHSFQGKMVAMSFASESDGTARLLDLAAILLSEDSEKVFFIDEFDRCLHPLLVVQLVKDYLNKTKDPKNHSQLIITTHESLLMDLNVLRRDEIWFFEKKDGSSFLFSLEEFQERFDKRVAKQYLEGRYGAVPYFGETIGAINTDED